MNQFLKIIMAQLLVGVLLQNIVAQEQQSNSSGLKNRPRSESEAISMVSGTDNELQKRETVLAWLNTVAANESSTRLTAGTTSADALLTLCLRDKSPVVVAEAVEGVRKVKANKFEAELITLYENAQQYFGGYIERVQLSIVKTLGVIGSKETSQLFADLLTKDNGSLAGSELLNAIRTLGDPAMCPYLLQYAGRLDGHVERAKAQKLDPMIFSQVVRNAALAREIVRNLNSGKGE